MCTAMTLETAQGEVYLGRTMDFSVTLDPSLYFVPKGYRWGNLAATHTVRNQYSFIAVGQDASPVVFVDGVNEKGFGAAVLYFPGYAYYDPLDSGQDTRPPIASIELMHFLLSQCTDVDDAAEILRTIRIVGMEDPVTESVAPLHWIMADKSGRCAVIEKTKEGLFVMDNPIGILTNSPDFSWQITNLRNYSNLSPWQMQDKKWCGVQLPPFGQGAGGFGLPGDYSPPSRFVRTAFQKSHADSCSTPEEAVITGVHLMENVSIPKGVVMTDRNTADFTQYTAFIRLSTQEYFFTTYNNRQITRAAMPGIREEEPAIRSLGKLIRPVTFDEFPG